MAENKTKPTEASVETYLAAIEDEIRRTDCKALSELMTRATGQPPKLWGSSIVGFGSYRYRYDSGREGESCLIGFASRKGDISVYLMADFCERDALLAKLGKHKMGKGCLYLRRLADVDAEVLEQLVAGAIAETQRRHATT
jgi:hypothetical protein